MRYEIWNFQSNERLATFTDEARALVSVRLLLTTSEPGVINTLGLVTVGGPTLTYPLEGAALLAKAFGLNDGNDGLSPVNDVSEIPSFSTVAVKSQGRMPSRRVTFFRSWMS